MKVGEQMMEEAIQGMARKQGVGGGSGWSPTVPFEDTHPVAPDPSPWSFHHFLTDHPGDTDLWGTVTV